MHFDSVEYNKMPDMKHIFEGRKNREAYGKFCDYFLGYGVSDGTDQFKIRKVVDEISYIASIVDKAFVLLALENGYEMWNYKVLKAHSLEEVGRESSIT